MTPPVKIRQLDADTLRALADGDLAAAVGTSPVPLTRYLAGPECRSTWARRAGYHGPPDGDGTVEVGYSIDPQFRRQGYSRAALRALVGRADRKEGVTTVRASVSPDNVASRDLVLSEGFVAVGD